ncbi:DUF4199 domain-containing protein [Spongiimicrobium sp. 2-473A-2-J]|uniref:DUF4199 domain-containing protein n=1 Tax=Eudoraea algarum TaxID=3417568 RepID=UPI003D36F22C
MEKSARQIALRYGLYLGLFLFVYGLFYRLAEVSHSSPLGYIFYIALPIGVFLAIRQFKRRNSMANFKNSFIISAIVVIIGSAIYSLFVYVYNKFIDDGLLKIIREENMEKIGNNGTLTEDQVEQSLKLVDILSQPGAFSITIFIQLLVFGIITALLLVWFMTRKR